MTEHLRKQGAMMNGRQVLWIIYHHYSMDKYLEQVYSYVDLAAVKFLGDAQLESFLNKWRDVVNNMVETPSEMFLTQLFLKQIKQSQALQNEVAMYHRAEQGHPERTYQFVYESALKLVERWRCDKNKQEMFKDVTTLGGVSTGKGVQGKGNPAISGRTLERVIVTSVSLLMMVRQSLCRQRQRRQKEKEPIGRRVRRAKRKVERSCLVLSWPMAESATKVTLVSVLMIPLSLRLIRKRNLKNVLGKQKEKGRQRVGISIVIFGEWVLVESVMKRKRGP